MQLEITPVKGLNGEITVPADKSISHRAVMIAGLCEGRSKIENFLMSEDCLRTVECFASLGIEIEKFHDGEMDCLYVKGKGVRGLSSPNDILYVGNSGTTIRLILGILSGQEFLSTITGDESIKKRPMLRVVEPLRQMGATIHGREGGNFAPIEIKGSRLNPIEYSLPVASAQAKSCLMLAGLFAEGMTRITEPSASRDHTERMFEHFGIEFSKSENTVSVFMCDKIEPTVISIPGDISSAAFFMVAGTIIPNSKITIKNVGLNPTRTGIIDVLHRMGANIEIENETMISKEPRGDITVRSSNLKGIELSGTIIPRIIDELPIIAVAASVAQGETVISDAKELRVKESDRIKTISTELKRLGAKIKEKDDGMIINGGTSFKGAVCESYGDHRVAMSLAIAGLMSKGGVTIGDAQCIETSFPGFEALLQKLRH